MIIEKVPKREVPEGQWISHNKNLTVISMTKDEAVALIAELVKFLHEDPSRCYGGPNFVEGMWYENYIAFGVYKEKDYVEHLYELRKEAEKEDE